MYQILQAKIEDINKLSSISRTWNVPYNEALNSNMEEYFYNCITNGDLPPIKEANIANYKLNIIQYNNDVICYFDLYYGYLKIDHLWISVFVISSEFRSMGHARKILKKIEAEMIPNSINKIAIGVNLSNISGLKFWTQNGFTDVLGVYGDNTEGIIGLTKRISK